MYVSAYSSSNAYSMNAGCSGASHCGCSGASTTGGSTYSGCSGAVSNSSTVSASTTSCPGGASQSNPAAVYTPSTPAPKATYTNPYTTDSPKSTSSSYEEIFISKDKYGNTNQTNNGEKYKYTAPIEKVKEKQFIYQETLICYPSEPSSIPVYNDETTISTSTSPNEVQPIITSSTTTVSVNNTSPTSVCPGAVCSGTTGIRSSSPSCPGAVCNGATSINSSSPSCPGSITSPTSRQHITSSIVTDNPSRPICPGAVCPGTAAISSSSPSCPGAICPGATSINSSSDSCSDAICPGAVDDENEICIDCGHEELEKYFSPNTDAPFKKLLDKLKDKTKKPSIIDKKNESAINKLSDLAKIANKYGYIKVRLNDLGQNGKGSADVYIYITNPNTERVTASVGVAHERESIQKIVSENKQNVIAATNGGFFNFDPSGQSEAFGNLAINGIDYSTDGNRRYKPTIIIGKNGSLSMATFTTDNQYYSKVNDVTCMISGGSNCALVENGVANTSSSHYNGQMGNPNQAKARTLLGYQKDGSIVMVTVDGSSGNAGITGVESAKLMKNLGCKNAILLDGSGSSKFMYDDKIQNQPVDNRLIGSAILVVKK